MIEIYPMLLKPCYKDYLWGGSRLCNEFGKEDAPTPTAESWELVNRNDDKSTITNGSLAGKTLEDLRQLDADRFWGTQCPKDRFPLLVKLIDAESDLSIQVHPSEDTAQMDAGEQGKAEMWYVVDCLPHAYIYYGFSRKIDENEFIQRVNDGTIFDVLNKVPVERGDVFYILPGVIHAICSGIVIAEIQQNSDTTFRIYDYLRQNMRGEMRPLHLQRAKSVIDYTPIIPTNCKVNSGALFDGFSMAEMFSCRYFRAYRFDITKDVHIRSDPRSFQHILFVEGHGVLRYKDWEIPFRKGNSFFIPAVLGEYFVEGSCRMLLSHV
ncbi:MAG: mannose-6-phosphate isomerase [Firmicutes bacterium HGW-Firmicutes-9]|nr:MAG: mannose-6-phosphate isomerase [Firmicutes bacterium HGW-Firmicutes-9]